MTNNITDQPIFEPSNAPFLPVALRYGLIGAAITIIYTLLANLTGLSSPANPMLSMLNGLIALAISITVPVLAVREYRQTHLGGYIEFLPAMLTALVTLLVMLVLGVVFNIVYTTYIDPTFMERTLSEMAESYSKMGMSEGDVEELMLQMEGRLDPRKGALFTLGVGAAIDVVIAAIIGAVMKRRPAPII